MNPTFIWVLKRDVIDYRFLTRDQMVNHYCKAGSFTTKVCNSCFLAKYTYESLNGELIPLFLMIGDICDLKFNDFKTNI